jgi:intracellular sulfur oxidation DsrE/DsrF family protein
MSTEKYSDEFLNAFVDGELAPDEKSRAFLEISRDEALNHRVCELRKLRDLVQHAYAHPPLPPGGLARAGTVSRVRLHIAAGVALAVGIMLGWSLHQPPEHAPASGTTLLTASAPDSSPANAPAEADGKAADVVISSTRYSRGEQPAAAGEPPKVLIHLNDGVVEHQRQALNDVEELLKHYRARRQPARVEIVINGQGLNLVRADVTPFAERIDRMQKEYDNLSFVACQNTIDRLKRDQGITARLLPGVVVIDSGVAQLMRRQHQGWAYIQT